MYSYRCPKFCFLKRDFYAIYRNPKHSIDEEIVVALFPHNTVQFLVKSKMNVERFSYNIIKFEMIFNLCY